VLEGGRCDTEGSDFLALVFIAEEQVRGPVELRLRWRQAERRWREHPLAVWTTPTERTPEQAEQAEQAVLLLQLSAAGGTWVAADLTRELK